MKRLLLICVCALLVFTPTMLLAQLHIPNVFSDNMVLQQGKKVNIWGTSAAGQHIEVTFGKQTQKTMADDMGCWQLQLNELSSTNKPQQIVVRAGREQIVLHNILVGEVWLASGQSNMEYSMNNHPHYSKPKRGDRDYLNKAYRSANNPLIRVMHVEKSLKSDTLPTKGWQVLSPESLAPISAIGYFFAQSLAESLNTPIGIISTSWGGTPIEAWTPERAYRDSPLFKDDVVRDQYKGVEVGKRFNKMIAPIIPYTLQGFIWYQGEQNVITADQEIYAAKQRLLIESWRSLWRDDSLSFYYAQLTPFSYSERRNDLVAKTWEALPNFRQAQTDCMSLSRTGMVVTTDLVDDLKNIHPSYKWEIGRRLARWALAKDYHKKDVVYMGPTYKSISIDGPNVIIEFDNTAQGLVTNDGVSPSWFWVTDRHGRYFKADARIDGANRIVVTSKNIKNPIAVRFAWDEAATPNLFNSAGLPAFPFNVTTAQATTKL